MTLLPHSAFLVPTDMESSESEICSCIIKLWHEKDGSTQPVWRGYITHIPSGERGYVADIADITAFIKQRLAQAGLCATQRPRLARWLRRWRRRKPKANP